MQKRTGLTPRNPTTNGALQTTVNTGIAHLVTINHNHLLKTAAAYAQRAPS
jgi:hypothetical protein